MSSIVRLTKNDRVNQTHSCENSKVINGLLKNELDFQGFVMTDWGAMTAGVSAALAGVDMNMPGFIGYGADQGNQPDPSTANNSYWGAALVQAVNNGSVPLSRVQDMVTRTSVLLNIDPTTCHGANTCEG